MGDLVQRLRAWEVWELDKGPAPPPTSFGEAADRIEALEAALRELASDNYHIDDYQQIARRALEGKP